MQAMSTAPRLPARRQWLVLAVLLPLLVAVPTTIAMWSGQDHTVQPAPAAPQVPLFDRTANATIFYVIDTSPLAVPTASVLEYLVETAPGQSASSSRSDVLRAITPPPCHVPPLCQLQQVNEFAFQARAPGTTVLTFHLGLCQGCGGDRVVRKTVQVVLLPQVARGHRSG
jgi:hypothetical protein